MSANFRDRLTDDLLLRCSLGLFNLLFSVSHDGGTRCYHAAAEPRCSRLSGRTVGSLLMFQTWPRAAKQPRKHLSARRVISAANGRGAKYGGKIIIDTDSANIENTLYFIANFFVFMLKKDFKTSITERIFACNMQYVISILLL